MNILSNLENQLIISVQAMPDEPLYDENCIMGLVRSVVNLSGIKALRLAGERDIKNVKKEFPFVSVIGITKPPKIPENYKEIVYITPTVEDCKKVIEAGANIVAFDGTMRNRPNGESLKEAKNAASLGCDIISTTLSGYTKETENNPDTPDFELVKKIRENLDIFTILEGKVWEKSDVKKAFEMGANSVVIGSAVTRPQLIVKRFMGAIK